MRRSRPILQVGLEACRFEKSAYNSLTLGLGWPDRERQQEGGGITPPLSCCTALHYMEKFQVMSYKKGKIVRVNNAATRMPTLYKT